MSVSVEEIVLRLKDEFSGELVTQVGEARRKFSREFKRRVLSESKANGISIGTLANALGIGSSTVCNWRRQIELRGRPFQKAPFRKLEIETEPKINGELPPYLEGKAGVKIVGLSLSQMAELLRCL